MKRHEETSYFAIFIYLSVLTAAELAVYAWFPGVVKIAFLVALAWAKATLVAMYFMHLRFERRTLAIIAFIPVVLVTFLTFMLLPDLTARLWAHADAHQQNRRSVRRVVSSRDAASVVTMRSFLAAS